MSEKRWLPRLRTTMFLAVCAVFLAVAPAGAVTLGDTTLPSGSTMGPACSTSSNAEIIQTATDSSFGYTVPAGGGSINSWSFNTTGATAGTPYSLLVARPSGSSYQIVGSDSVTVPSSSPAIASFSLAKPITVQGGDVLGVIVTAGKNTVDCRFKGGALPDDDIVGSSLSSTATGSIFNLSNTTPNELVNVAANLVQSNDVAVSQKAEPSSISQGDYGAFVISVTNSGPSSTPITLTDTIPDGLSLISASAGTGTCTSSGQQVTCSLEGAPASVAIVVSPTNTGTYTNSASVRGAITDPDSGNNSSTAKLTVVAGGGPSGGSGGSGGSSGPAGTTIPVVTSRCLIPALKGLSLAKAKTVLHVLGCVTGKVTKKSSTSVRKGNIVSTTPRAGSSGPLGKKVGLVVSSGKPPKKAKGKHKKHKPKPKKGHKQH
jgi:uncharacterized repeat protein (TIGR01451 family)